MTADAPPPPPASAAAPVPRFLLLSVGAVALEALAYAGVGVAELFAIEGDDPAVGISTGLFFVGFAGFLAFCAHRLRALESWVRAPIVMTQLIQIPIGISFWGDGWTAAVSIVMWSLSALTLVGIFHPASLAALEES